MKINIEKAIEFFDDPSERGHASSIVGVIGEDLNTASFKHYMETKKDAKVEIPSEPVTTGRLKGKRLDRWIYVVEKKKRTLYQCEIKNWSATALGGKYLKKDADHIAVFKVAAHHWSNQNSFFFMDRQFPNGVTKVLLGGMKPPEAYKGIEIEPLIIYWMPISISKDLKPFFKVPVSSFNNPSMRTSFEILSFFSVSLYLRELRHKTTSKYIELNMPDVEHRRGVLKDLFG